MTLHKATIDFHDPLDLPDLSSTVIALQRIAPLRRIDDDGHQTAGNDPGDRQRDDPTEIDPSYHPPIDGLDVTRAQAHPDRRARDALRRADRQRQSCRHHHRQRTSQFHGEATRRRMQRQSVSEVAHDVVAIGPEANDDGDGAVDENPDGDRAFGREFAGAPDEEDGGEGAQRVGDVVGAVRERGRRRRHDL